MKPRMNEIEAAIEVLVGAGIPPATFQDKLDELESTGFPSTPRESKRILDRRASRALRRGREPKRKPNPTEEAIQILTEVGFDPGALRGELRAARTAAIPFGQKPPPVTYPPFDIKKTIPDVDFENTAIDQAIATLVAEGISLNEASELVEGRAGEIRTKAREIGSQVYENIPHQGEIPLRLSRAAADMKSWILNIFT